MVRGILFDLDGTLFDRESAIRDLLIDQHQRFSADLFDLPCDTYIARILALDAHGHGDKTVAYRQAAREFALPVSLAERLTTDFWSRYHSFCRCFPDVLPALNELRHRGLRLGIITNGTVRIQEPAIRQLGLFGIMDTVHISEREGVRKPDREIFERALRALDVNAGEAWYVGDHPDVDVRGAVAAGLTAVWKRTSYWPEPGVPHRAIGGLDELLTWIPAAGGVLPN